MEWRKVSTKTIWLLLGLFFVQAFFFLYSVNLQKQQADEFMTEAYLEYNDAYITSQTEYVNGYRAYIEAIIKQADELGGISIFSKLDSFSESNLEETKQDFERVLDVEPVVFDDIYLKQFFAYTAINGFVLLGGVFVAFSLVDSKKKGLRSIIYSSVNGRGRLVLNKIVTLLMWDAILVVLFYVGNLVLSAVRFGGNIVACMSYPIQSVSDFAKFPWDMSIGTFLVCYILYKILMTFTITLVVWLILFCTDNTIISVGIVGVLGGVLYILYCIVEANSPYNYLRYCNFWYLMTDMSIFTEYKNLNWFGDAVNKDVFIFTTSFVIMIILIAVAVTVGIKRYPNSSKVRSTRIHIDIFDKIKIFIKSIPERFSVGMFECYKILIKQNGIVVILVLLIVLVSQIDVEKVQRFREQELYYDFMEKYEGAPGAESEQYIAELAEQLTQLDAEYEQNALAYEAGNISSEEWFAFGMKYNSYVSERVFLAQIQEQQAYLHNLKTERGINGWYVNIYGFNHLFDTEDTVGNIGLIFAVVLICSGLFAFEKRSGTLSIVRGGRDGRFKVFSSKLQVAIITTLVLLGLTTVIEIISIEYVYGLSGWGAPVQSIHMLDFVPFECNIGVFVALMYLLKAFVIVCLAIFVCIVSMKVSQKKTITISFLLCTPALLSSIGLVGFENYSIISVMSIGPMLLKTENIAVVGLIALLIGVVGTVSLLRGYKKWCIT